MWHLGSLVETDDVEILGVCNIVDIHSFDLIIE